MSMQVALNIMQMGLTFGNLCIMFYALTKFINKPHDTLVSRVTNLEVKLGEIEDSLKQGNDRFREQTSTNEVIIHSVLALIEFEIAYCYTENKPISKNLEKAKDDLNNFLAKRNNN